MQLSPLAKAKMNPPQYLEQKKNDTFDFWIFAGLASRMGRIFIVLVEFIQSKKAKAEQELCEITP